MLAGCYRASLALARRHEVASIAFPAISCGIYGYPWQDAVNIAVTTVRDELRAGGPEHVLFACFDQVMLGLYADMLAG